jgi:plastocyanin
MRPGRTGRRAGSARRSGLPVRVLAVSILVIGPVTACTSGASDSGPGFGTEAGTGSATYEYTIPVGAGEALDAGEPLEILPATLEATVGETIEIVNLDDRGHNVGPWFIGANETLRQEFTSPGTFEGVCTVHPSGQLVLRVGA